MSTKTRTESSELPLAFVTTPTKRPMATIEGGDHSNLMLNSSVKMTHGILSSARDNREANIHLMGCTHDAHAQTSERDEFPFRLAARTAFAAFCSWRYGLHEQRTRVRDATLPV